MDIDLIYAVSEIDREIIAIEREINKKAVLDELFRLKDEYEKIKSEYEKLLSEYERDSNAIADLTTKNDRLVNDLKEIEKKLYTSSNLKSIEVMQHSQDKLKNEIQNNENSIYTCLEEQERAQKMRIEYKKKLSTLSSTYNSMRKEYQEHISSLKDSISSLKEKRKSMISKIDENIVREYESIRKSKGYGMSVLKGEICTGCGMGVPYIIISDARKHKSLQKCPNCGRFIYIAD